MHPELLTIGSWQLRSYDAALLLAIVLGVVLFWREAKRAGFPARHLLVFCAGAVVSGLLGGRLNAWLFHLGSAPTWPNLNPISTRGGLTSFGSILATLAYALIYARWQGWRVGAFLDVAAPIIPLVEGVLRWGCLLNGCCYGRETDSFLGVYLPDASGHWAHRYPTQIMISLFCLGLSAWLWRRRRRSSFRGELILSYLVVYHVGRFGLDLLRGDQQAVTGMFTAYQLVSLAIAVVAATGMMLLERAGIDRAPAAGPDTLDLDL
jgi:phosphatidylglycerol:prolipoprotein diacylglycerol transferase